METLLPDDPGEIAGYRLRGRLGEGGMGTVYLSYTRGGQPVALKVVRREFARDPEFRRRFAQEVAAARRVQGPYTAPVLDSDTEGPQPWLATAFVAGPSLARAVTEHGPLPPRTVLQLAAGVAEALQSIHATDVVHRDLKPSNVLLASDGPRVIDFGIARAADTTALTGTDVRLGTPAFMAPEQVSGRETGPALDVFALGLLIFFASTGNHPFGEGASHALLYRIVAQEPDLTACPVELRELIGRCLAKEAADRPSPSEAIDACRELAGDDSLRRGANWWLPQQVAEDVAGQERTLKLASSGAPPAPAPGRAGAGAAGPARSSGPPALEQPVPGQPVPAAQPPAPTRPMTVGTPPRPSEHPPAAGNAAGRYGRPERPTHRGVRRLIAVAAGALAVAAVSVSATLLLTGDDGNTGSGAAGPPRKEPGWQLVRSDVPLVIEAPPFDPGSNTDAIAGVGECWAAKATLVNLESLTVSTNQRDKLDSSLPAGTALRYVNCATRYVNDGLKLIDGRGVMSTTENDNPTPSECRDAARESAIDNPVTIEDITADSVLREGIGLCVETDRKTVVHLRITRVKKQVGREDLRTYVTTATQWVPEQSPAS